MSDKKMVSAELLAKLINSAEWQESDFERSNSPFKIEIKETIRQAKSALAEQHQGEPVARVDEADDGLFVELIYGDNGNPLRRGDKLYTRPAPAVQQEPVEVLGYSVKGNRYAIPLTKGELLPLHEGYTGDALIELVDRRLLDGRADTGEVERLRAALKFYADREHYHFESGNWDTVSGEPLNILWCGDEPDFIEDGTVARNALSASAEPSAPGVKLMAAAPAEAHLGAMASAMDVIMAELSAPKCTYCGDTGQIMVGRSGDANDGNAPIMEPCEDCERGAPVERDERAAFERHCGAIGFTLKRHPNGDYAYGYGHEVWSGWQARAILEGSKPTVLSKCVLCDQLQADLTARDEKLDQTQDLLRYMVYDYRSVVQAGYDRITAIGSDCDSVAKMLTDNPNYQKALALLLPDLESRPEERGSPETEPCSGCGTPGYTAACEKCVPY